MEKQMANSPVDKSQEFIESGKTLISETSSDVHLNDINLKTYKFKKQNEIHSKIRNDEDYDDWEYGTEPTYGK